MTKHTVYFGHIDDLNAEIADGIFHAEFGAFAAYLTSETGDYAPEYFNTLAEAHAEAQLLATIYSTHAIGI
jgi:hypothetical protein